MAGVQDKPPFIIHALGRSRTAWLAVFLSHGKWRCFHEIAIYMRSVDDIRQFFLQPNVGTAETASSFGWPLIRHLCPNVRHIVVSRDPDEAAASMAAQYVRCGIPYDAKKLSSIFRRAAKSLGRISAVPGTVTFTHDEIGTQDGCRRIFEECTNSMFDARWWKAMRDRHVEADLRALVDYYQRHYGEVERFKKLCKTELMRLARNGELRNAIH